MARKLLGKTGGMILILLGIGLFCYPDISEWFLKQQTMQYIDDFQRKYQEKSVKKPAEEGIVGETIVEGGELGDNSVQEEAALEKNSLYEKENDPLYQEILLYNQEIYNNGQSGFRDAWSYEQAPIVLDGLEDGKFGYMEIPSMDVTLPLYIGASSSNMSKGAAILGQTSIPIGGQNTNSVIAAHRGWSTGAFLRDIEKVSIGDMVYIINPWERMAYQVETIDIVYPDDSDAVKIQENRDMITICTCHPYLSRGKYRYLLYCVRDEEAEEGSGKVSLSASEQGTDKEHSDNSAQSKGDCIIASNGVQYETSGSTIQMERFVRRGSAAAIAAILLMSFLHAKPGRSTVKKKRETDKEKDR